MRGRTLFWRRAPWALTLILLGLPLLGAETLTEKKVKAAFLYNFAKFVQWPAGSLSSSRQPFVFCTLGATPLGGTLDEVLQGKTIDDHPLLARHLASLASVNGCQVLFVSAPKDGGAFTFPANLRLPGLLTVTEAESKNQVCKNGAIITFVLESNRVRFVIDDKAAQKVGLVISSKLLSLALPAGK
ncbi:MAG TPA: YfiR family protein [Bryobacteraceae bacterium]|nr:YfiR family protein [Bryobacteraceae bacterium]